MTKKNIIVTGGLSGLGLSTVQHLLKCDFTNKIAVFDLHRDTHPFEKEARVLVLAVDVANDGEVEAAFRRAHDAFGGPATVLVNCAGVGVAARLATSRGPHDLALFKRVMEINAFGTFNTCRLFAAALIQKHGSPKHGDELGVIVNVASVAALEPQIGQVAYAFSKGAVASGTLAMARDLGRYNIRCVSVAPSMFRTPMTQLMDDNVTQKMMVHQPFPHRPGKPEEFALLCESIIINPMLNGSVIRLDGACRMPAAL